MIPPMQVEGAATTTFRLPVEGGDAILSVTMLAEGGLPLLAVDLPPGNMGPKAYTVSRAARLYSALRDWGDIGAIRLLAERDSTLERVFGPALRLARRTP